MGTHVTIGRAFGAWAMRNVFFQVRTLYGKNTLRVTVHKHLAAVNTTPKTQHAHGKYPIIVR